MNLRRRWRSSPTRKRTSQTERTGEVARERLRVRGAKPPRKRRTKECERAKRVSLAPGREPAEGGERGRE
jgi:hypothetical protein